jgi:UDP-3-O-[3-hydroxymyristoyl] glucosamine N-acyltransferase
MTRSYTLNFLAERFGLELHGDGQRAVDGVATLAAAGPSQLSFLSNPSYRSQLPTTGAGVVLVAAGDVERAPCAALVSRNVYADFARIAALFETRPAAVPGIHPSAVVHPGATVDPSAAIGPFVSIGEGSRIGAGAEIGPGCVIGHDCTVGAGTRLSARVVLVQNVTLGERVLIHPGAVLGADGFGLAMDRGNWMKVPQLGGVRVGDDSEIGANTTIDRGALGDTVIGNDVRLDNQIQIGHNCEIGDHTAMAGCVGIAGSTRIGKNCLIGGAVGIVGHISICDRVVVTGLSMVSSSITEPGEYSSGIPAQPHKVWQKNLARLRKLDDTVRRLSGAGKD